MSGLQTVTTPRLRIETVATREATRFLSEMIQMFLKEGLGLSIESPDSVRVRLAITEALSNVARHGYPNGETGPLTHEMAREGAHLVAVVQDYGEAFDPSDRIEAVIPRGDELAEGGYGLGIIRAVMDELSHEHDANDGNRFTMKKKLWD